MSLHTGLVVCYLFCTLVLSKDDLSVISNTQRYSAFLMLKQKQRMSIFDAIQN